MQWALAAAAVFMLALDIWTILHPPKLERFQPRPAEAVLLRGIPNANILNIGLGDHINCAVLRGFQNKRFTSEEMSESLGSDFAGLVSILKSQAPGFEIVVAHRCHVDDREFVHLILRNQERACSLVITKKNGESFPADEAAGNQTKATATYRARTREYEVTGFETREFLGFVVSNLPTSENRILASNLAPVVRGFLAKLET
jgi:hypothetical protein